jgi:hypothetical protein
MNWFNLDRFHHETAQAVSLSGNDKDWRAT